MMIKHLSSCRNCVTVVFALGKSTDSTLNCMIGITYQKLDAHAVMLTVVEIYCYHIRKAIEQSLEVAAFEQ